MSRDQSTPAVAELAAQAELFNGLSPEQLESVAGIAVFRRSPKGEILFSAGDEARGFYSVVSGRIKVYLAAPSGKEKIIHVFGPGHVFGEVPVFQGESFPASAQALDDSVLLFFPRAGFKRLIVADPDLAMNMLGLLSGRLRQLVAQTAALSLTEVPARLAAYLLLLRETRDSDLLTLDLQKGQIASYLGTIQETLSRVLKRMAEQGMIKSQARTIEIIDREGLERLAAGLDNL